MCVWQGGSHRGWPGTHKGNLESGPAPVGRHVARGNCVPTYAFFVFAKKGQRPCIQPQFPRARIACLTCKCANGCAPVCCTRLPIQPHVTDTLSSQCLLHQVKHAHKLTEHNRLDRRGGRGSASSSGCSSLCAEGGTRKGGMDGWMEGGKRTRVGAIRQ